MRVALPLVISSEARRQGRLLARWTARPWHRTPLPAAVRAAARASTPASGFRRPRGPAFSLRDALGRVLRLGQTPGATARPEGEWLYRPRQEGPHKPARASRPSYEVCKADIGTPYRQESSCAAHPVPRFTRTDHSAAALAPLAAIGCPSSTRRRVCGCLPIHAPGDALGDLPRAPARPEPLGPGVCGSSPPPSRHAPLSLRSALTAEPLEAPQGRRAGRPGGLP